MKVIQIIFFLFVFAGATNAQMITGVWKGKVGSGLKASRLELKLVLKGDSITGTSYYHEGPNNYRRYSVKGFFNPQTNEVTWWDDVLIEQVVPGFRVLSPNEIPLLLEADFNCPGGDVMKLDGKAVSKNDQTGKGEVHLDKVAKPLFTDEWNWVIENYTFGANDPEIIDSIAMVQLRSNPPVVAAAPTNKPEAPATNASIPKPASIPTPAPQPVNQPVPEPIQPVATPVMIQPTAAPANKPAATVLPPAAAAKPPAIEEKFIQRKKVLTTELPLAGDTVELHFYDNAEIDGDSISLFLNNQLLFQHVKLSDKPHIIKLPVHELAASNELVMVAENLGAIPPNTSYMIAYINGQRYTANLESSEGSSAMIRLVRRQ